MHKLFQEAYRKMQEIREQQLIHAFELKGFQFESKIQFGEFLKNECHSIQTFPSKRISYYYHYEKEDQKFILSYIDDWKIEETDDGVLLITEPPSYREDEILTTFVEEGGDYSIEKATSVLDGTD